ncbi:TraB/GumN family protein [Cellvibrio japonicus]|uniref:GumN protein superfamily n=1 Tax=Cellvibrio japonicus (strain Ueda107) TaxID=498211 RepID=B3PJJ2_CELJU|nr:TraB/GumN family protein [Cellvibrio japonicus]ACE86160.1 GumN protein superfamily [Cellvibrio japonicus Ueda107]QEI11278.1 TraB/GumN family protein [Cellvibrio japonicus]QEI14852.1 TraB/GumN family protein [Cellvibrio japonicus]QEI18432.1 TraB/GumN family protein [Cellvibrio japonicus]
MKKGILLWLVMLLVAPLASAESSIYEVSKGQSKLYLGGTIHLLRDSDFPLPEEFEQAYHQSRKLVLEANLQKASSPEYGQQVARAMMYTDGRDLSKVLSPDTWKALQAYADKRGFPLSQVSMFKPLFVSLMMTVTEAQRLGMGEGVDAYFDRMARLANKPVGELESTDDVILYMQKIAEVKPDQMMRTTLRDLQTMESSIDDMIRHWRQGNMKALDKELNGSMRKDLPEVYRSLVVERNNAWLPQIIELLATPEVELVLVGALHLSGKDGLLAQLKKRGYNVKPYQLQR